MGVIQFAGLGRRGGRIMKMMTRKQLFAAPKPAASAELARGIPLFRSLAEPIRAALLLKISDLVVGRTATGMKKCAAFPGRSMTKSDLSAEGWGAGVRGAAGGCMTCAGASRQGCSASECASKSPRRC